MRLEQWIYTIPLRLRALFHPIAWTQNLTKRSVITWTARLNSIWPVA